MQISFENKSKYGKFIKISTTEQDANIYSEDLAPNQFANTKEIAILTNTREPRNIRSDEGGMVISTPGEFEKNGVFIWTQRNNKSAGSEEESHNIDFVEVETDGIRVLYYAGIGELNRDILNDMGMIDVLLLNVREDFNKQLKVISVVDPQIVIPVFADGVDIEKFKTESGVKFNPEKKLKCKASDFASEEHVLQGVIIEN